jgi:hypothetical protein
LRHRHCRVSPTCRNLAGSGTPRLASLALDLTDCGDSFSRTRTWRWSREPAGWVGGAQHAMPR